MSRWRDLLAAVQSGAHERPARLAAAAAAFPCRVIPGEEGTYLSRYTLDELPDGGFLYLHFFHRGDFDLRLHNHPWPGRSLILTGGYLEERRVGDSTIVRRRFFPGDESVLHEDTFHRVDLNRPAEGCWTLFEAGPKSQSWGFWCRHTGEFTPWREYLRSRGLLPAEAT